MVTPLLDLLEPAVMLVLFRRGAGMLLGPGMLLVEPSGSYLLYVPRRLGVRPPTSSSSMSSGSKRPMLCE